MTKRWILLEGVPPRTYKDMFIKNNVLYVVNGTITLAILNMQITSGTFHKKELNGVPAMNVKTTGYSVDYNNFLSSMTVMVSLPDDPRFWAEITYT